PQRGFTPESRTRRRYVEPRWGSIRLNREPCTQGARHAPRPWAMVFNALGVSAFPDQKTPTGFQTKAQGRHSRSAPWNREPRRIENVINLNPTGFHIALATPQPKNLPNSAPAGHFSVRFFVRFAIDREGEDMRMHWPASRTPPLKSRST